MTPSSVHENATIGEILKENGYATSWFGKNHNTPGFHIQHHGWTVRAMAVGMGFQYFYGFMGGETDQWEPYLFRDHTRSLSVGRQDPATTSSLIWRMTPSGTCVI